MDGGLDLNGQSSGRVFQPHSVSQKLETDTAELILALQYPYVIAFEPTFVEVHHVETGHLVQIIPGTGISCLFADTPPSRVNAPLPVPNRQLMYPPVPPGQPGYRSGASPFQPQQGYHPQQPYSTNHQSHLQHPQMRPPPMPFGMPMPPPPPRFARPQIIFTSDDGHVQFLKFPTPQQRGPPQVHGRNKASH